MLGSKGYFTFSTEKKGIIKDTDGNSEVKAQVFLATRRVIALLENKI